MSHDSLLDPDLACRIIAGAIDTVVTAEVVESTGDHKLDVAIARLAADVRKLDDVLPEKPVQFLRDRRDHIEGQSTLKFYPENLN